MPLILLFPSSFVVDALSVTRAICWLDAHIALTVEKEKIKVTVSPPYFLLFSLWRRWWKLRRPPNNSLCRKHLALPFAQQFILLGSPPRSGAYTLSSPSFNLWLFYDPSAGVVTLHHGPANWTGHLIFLHVFHAACSAWWKPANTVNQLSRPSTLLWSSCIEGTGSPGWWVVVAQKL